MQAHRCVALYNQNRKMAIGHNSMERIKLAEQPYTARHLRLNWTCLNSHSAAVRLWKTLLRVSIAALLLRIDNLPSFALLPRLLVFDSFRESFRDSDFDPFFDSLPPITHCSRS